ncbi:MAG TPA: hypothetical protein VF268_06125 [Gammaproteobacteria bacterium]|jgi:hypothetical protein
MSVIKFIANALLVFLSGFLMFFFWGQWESGSYIAPDGVIRSEWRAGSIFNGYEYFRESTEYIFDKYSEPGGRYFIVSSWFSYYDEPYVYYKPGAAGKIERYSIDVDIVILGLSVSLFMFLLVFMSYGNVFKICAGVRKPCRKYLFDLMLIGAPLVLASYQIHRIQNPTWKIHDEIVSNERYVEWSNAVDIIQSGKVSTVFQEHSRIVSMILDDGSTYVSLEPFVDAIVSAVDECGFRCERIILWTE